MLKRHQDLFPLEKSRVVGHNKGSFLNKLIILPLAFIKLFCTLVNYGRPILGAIYLAFDCLKKIYEYIVPHEHEVTKMFIIPSKEEVLALEKGKNKSSHNN
jgi:predicted DNA repair protein MutK